MLKDTLLELKKESKQIDNTVQSLQTNVNILRTEFDEFQSGNYHLCLDQDKLYLSLTTSQFEHTICSHVLPEVFEHDPYASLHELLNYLNGGDTLTSDPIDDECDDNDGWMFQAIQRWCKVCEDLDLPDEWKKRKDDWEISDCTVPSDI